MTDFAEQQPFTPPEDELYFDDYLRRVAGLLAVRPNIVVIMHVVDGNMHGEICDTSNIMQVAELVKSEHTLTSQNTAV